MKLILDLLPAHPASGVNVATPVPKARFQRIRVGEGSLTSGGIIALDAVASLAGALLGGLAGMHFHRKVDKAGIGR